MILTDESGTIFRVVCKLECPVPPQSVAFTFSHILWECQEPRHSLPGYRLNS